MCCCSAVGGSVVSLSSVVGRHVRWWAVGGGCDGNGNSAVASFPENSSGDWD